jgi:hypothetical protein
MSSLTNSGTTARACARNPANIVRKFPPPVPYFSMQREAYPAIVARSSRELHTGTKIPLN